MVHKKRLKSVIHAGWKRKKSEYPHKESNLRILRSDSLPWSYIEVETVN